MSFDNQIQKEKLRKIMQFMRYKDLFTLVLLLKIKFFLNFTRYITKVEYSTFEPW